MLLHSKLIISFSEFLNMTAEAVVGQLEGVQRLVVLFLENGERTMQILKVCLREEAGDFFLALRVYLLRVLTDRD